MTVERIATGVDRVIARALRRPPDFQIGGADNPYCNRWWVIPRNRLFNIYLHQFVRDDEDRALHDHPWLNCSILLRGTYHEERFEQQPKPGDPLPPRCSAPRRPGWPVFRWARTAHRVVLPRDADSVPVPCWSLFLTGPALRSWGFYCEGGRWVHWRDFTAGEHGEIVGRGCE